MIYKFLMLMLAVLAINFQTVQAHGDEDHSEPEVALTSETPTTNSRISAQTQDIELVAAASGHDLSIWLDDWETNAPIVNGNVSVTFAGETQQAVKKDDIFTVSFDGLDAPGEHQLAFIITHDGKTEALSALLNVAEPQSADSMLPNWFWPIIIGVVLILIIGIALRRRQRNLAALMILGIIGYGLLSPMPTIAHGDEDHSSEDAEESDQNQSATQISAQSNAQSNVEAAAIGNGEIFAPKAFQHAIALRTALVSISEVAPTALYSGRVISDPSKGGVVQSLNGGRLGAPSNGLPRVGDFVRAGQTLAVIEPAIDAAATINIAQSRAELALEIATARDEARRLERLKGVVPNARIVQAQIRLRGLTAQNNALSVARSNKEILRAPISGIVSQIDAQLGEVVTPQSNILIIANRGAFLIELDIFDGTLPLKGTLANGETVDGETFSLRLIGSGLGGAGGAVRAIFEPIDAPITLRIGSPVTVNVPTGSATKGVIVPTAAVVKDDNGADVVIIKTAPEQFEKKSVRVQPVGADNMAILAGVDAGQRIVTDGASLLAQIR